MSKLSHVAVKANFGYRRSVSTRLFVSTDEMPSDSLVENYSYYAIRIWFSVLELRKAVLKGIREVRRLVMVVKLWEDACPRQTHARVKKMTVHFQDSALIV